MSNGAWENHTSAESLTCGIELARETIGGISRNAFSGVVAAGGELTPLVNALRLREQQRENVAQRLAALPNQQDLRLHAAGVVRALRPIPADCRRVVRGHPTEARGDAVETNKRSTAVHTT